VLALFIGIAATALALACLGVAMVTQALA
jgi:hypothetical protein